MESIKIYPIKTTPNKIAGHLMEFRKAAGLSVVKLSELSGVSHRSIYSAENGEKVSTKTLKKVFAHLGYDLREQTELHIFKTSKK